MTVIKYKVTFQDSSTLKKIMLSFLIIFISLNAYSLNVNKKACDDNISEACFNAGTMEGNITMSAL